MVGSRAPAQARSQLADYKRHVVPKRGHCAVLLPAEPSDDSAA